MTDRQGMLGSVTPGMSKKVTSLGSFVTESGEECSYTSTATQTILKIQNEKLIVLSMESFAPQSTTACINANTQAYEERILFYEEKPLLSSDLEALDKATPDLASLIRTGEIVTMKLNLKAVQEDGTTVTDLVTIQYDLSKPSFKNLVLNQGTGYSTTTTDITNIDPNSTDLSDVLFCENNDGDNGECVQGNYSDILF